MGDDEKRLLEEARRSREETEELREEAAVDQDSEPEPASDDAPSPTEGEPWAKTSSGDAGSVTDDD
jgi:hypothetical protein